LPQHNADGSQKLNITEGYAIEWFMSAKDNTIPIAIVEPQARIDISPPGFGVDFGVGKKGGRG
jgi:hypothetical protein